MALTDEELFELQELLKLRDIETARSSLLEFTRYTFKKFKPAGFHLKYYDILNRFINREIKNLIISMPPQHGKSEGSSRRLPAMVAGVRPDDKIALVSYGATKAEKFGREIMGIMREPEFKDLFPDCKYPERGYNGVKANTNTNRESINSDGSMKFIGVAGALTGDPVDLLILDDLYKDWQDANSPTLQEKVWNWYLSVADTRLHNDSQQLIVFTRWSSSDLIGYLEKANKVVEWNPSMDVDEFLSSVRDDEFIKINFQAIKEDEPSVLDPRVAGEALWPDRHSLAKMISSRDKDPDIFNCLYQGEPQVKGGLMYQPFKTYDELPSLKIRKNYTDTADTGSDHLCSINYGIPLAGSDELIYVTGVLYTQDPMEKTEPATAELLTSQNVNLANIESNNGGRGFARNVQRMIKRSTTSVNWFHQGSNKEARIFSNSATVNRRIVFPSNWHILWPEFYKAVTTYKKIFSANKFDDAPDCLTGIVEKEFNSSEIWTGESEVI